MVATENEKPNFSMSNKDGELWQVMPFYNPTDLVATPQGPRIDFESGDMPKFQQLLGLGYISYLQNIVFWKTGGRGPRPPRARSLRSLYYKNLIISLKQHATEGVPTVTNCSGMKHKSSSGVSGQVAQSIPLA